MVTESLEPPVVDSADGEFVSGVLVDVKTVDSDAGVSPLVVSTVLDGIEEESVLAVSSARGEGNVFTLLVSIGSGELEDDKLVGDGSNDAVVGIVGSFGDELVSNEIDGDIVVSEESDGGELVSDGVDGVDIESDGDESVSRAIDDVDDVSEEPDAAGVISETVDVIEVVSEESDEDEVVSEIVDGVEVESGGIDEVEPVSEEADGDESRSAALADVDVSIILVVESDMDGVEMVVGTSMVEVISALEVVVSAVSDVVRDALSIDDETVVGSPVNVLSSVFIMVVDSSVEPRNKCIQVFLSDERNRGFS